MTIPYPNLKPVRAELRLDLVDSRGNAVAEMAASTARPMALSLMGDPMWYGFVLNDDSIERLLPGTSNLCTISFISHDSAKEALVIGSSALFGDGTSTKGVIRIVSFD
ncbi:hypothetical protein ABE522_04520 [Stenotrophomonas pennii]|uniref:hypothetical protein n=1 Tax=Stenotrophomonas lacuserhaii TaxID=2760084 RepID=UPI0032082F07